MKLTLLLVVFVLNAQVKIIICSAFVAFNTFRFAYLIPPFSFKKLHVGKKKSISVGNAPCILLLFSNLYGLQRTQRYKRRTKCCS